MIAETVYQGRDNPNLVTFFESGTGIDFSAATRFLMRFEGSDVEADTQVTSGLITTTGVQGQLRFEFNDLVIPPGRYAATLIVFDAAHLDGQVVVCAPDDALVFTFVANC